ncbi:MAG: 30S ribosomal protein S20 [Phycisphaerales bacterium]|nr:30S ribosomal protein S20 [Phycisphaerales bacterium]
MAHSLSAKKRIRQNLKCKQLNRWRKDNIKAAVKDFDDAVLAGDEAKMGETLKVACTTLDKVAGKGTIHKNTAARKKSRLSAAMHKALA